VTESAPAVRKSRLLAFQGRWRFLKSERLGVKKRSAGRLQTVRAVTGRKWADGTDIAFSGMSKTGR
jgi:hypothetical protein